MNSEIADAIDAFVDALQVRINAKYAKHYPNLTPDVVHVEAGRKYAKIVKASPTGMKGFSNRTVHCFIEMSTGDIYKSASWKAPAKHVRGSVLTEDHGMSAVDEYGAHYMR